jgi:hypothetical protein
MKKFEVGGRETYSHNYVEINPQFLAIPYAY